MPQGDEYLCIYPYVLIVFTLYLYRYLHKILDRVDKCLALLVWTSTSICVT